MAHGRYSINVAPFPLHCIADLPTVCQTSGWALEIDTALTMTASAACGQTEKLVLIVCSEENTVTVKPRGRGAQRRH